MLLHATWKNGETNSHKKFYGNRLRQSLSLSRWYAFALVFVAKYPDPWMARMGGPAGYNDEVKTGPAHPPGFARILLQVYFYSFVLVAFAHEATSTGNVLLEDRRRTVRLTSMVADRWHNPRANCAPRSRADRVRLLPLAGRHRKPTSAHTYPIAGTRLHRTIPGRGTHGSSTPAMTAFACWAWFILGAYVIVFVLYLCRGSKSTHRDILATSDHLATVSQGARWQSLSGLLLIISSLVWSTVGTVVAYGAWGMLQDLQTSLWTPIGGALLCQFVLAVLFVLWSIWTGFGRWGVVVDGRSKKVETWWGLVVPLARKSFDISEFSSVSVRALGRRRRRFQVRLEGAKRSLLLDRSVCRDPEEARQLATEVAAAGGLEVRDDTQK